MCSLRLWKNPSGNTDGEAGRREKGKESREGAKEKEDQQRGHQARSPTAVPGSLGEPLTPVGTFFVASQ